MWQDYDKDYKKMTRLWQGLFECDKIMTRTIKIKRIWQGLYKYDKSMTRTIKIKRIWQGLEENDKTMTRTIRKWQEYDKDYKKMTKLWQGL